MKKILLYAFSAIAIAMGATSCGGAGIYLNDEEAVNTKLVEKLTKAFGEETKYVNIHLTSDDKFSKMVISAVVTCIEPGSEDVVAYTFNLRNGKKEKAELDATFAGQDGFKINEIAFNMITPWIKTAGEDMEEHEYPFSGIEYYNIGTATDEFMLISKQGTTSKRRGKTTTYTTEYYEFKFVVDEEGVLHYIED